MEHTRFRQFPANLLDTSINDGGLWVSLLHALQMLDTTIDDGGLWVSLLNARQMLDTSINDGGMWVSLLNARQSQRLATVTRFLQTKRTVPQKSVENFLVETFNGKGVIYNKKKKKNCSNEVFSLQCGQTFIKRCAGTIALYQFVRSFF